MNPGKDLVSSIVDSSVKSVRRSTLDSIDYSILDFVNYSIFSSVFDASMVREIIVWEGVWFPI